MADIKISDLSAATSATANQQIEVNDGGVSKRITVDQVKTYVGAQPADATLTALAGVATAADKVPYFTGTDVASTATLTSFGRSLIDDTTASEARTTLGLASVAASGSASDLTTGTVATARLASGTANSTSYLRGDQTWSTITGYPGVNSQVFTSSGTFTVPSGITKVKVTLIGAGGNGGSTGINWNSLGSGGGAGGYVVDHISVTPGSNCTVTVGSNAGTRTSSFAGSTTLTAAGGSNGAAPASSGSNTPGVGLSAAASVFGITHYSSGPYRLSDLRFIADAGPVTSGTVVTSEGSVYDHGYGLAGGGRDTGTGNTNRHNSLGYGGGGGGGTVVTGATTGGTGGNGLVIVEW